MKNVSKLVAMLLSLILCFSLLVMPAAAAETTENGLLVTLTSDKAAYNEGDQIVLTLTVKNTNSYDLTDVVLAPEIPEGYQVAEGSVGSKTIAKLAAGQSEALTVVVEPIPDPTTSTTEPTTAPTTEPTTAPTTEPTTAPTTEPTTAPTTEPTTAPTTEPTTAPATVTITKQDTAQAGKTYKYGLYQAGKETQLWFNGEMDGYYLALSENIEDAVDVTVEAVEGGYHLSFTKDGAKKYIDIVAREGKAGSANVVITDTPTAVLTWDETAKTFFAVIGEDTFYLGTYGNYGTISASKTSYITGDNASKVDVSQYVSHLYVVSTSNGSTGDSSSQTGDNSMLLLPMVLLLLAVAGLVVAAKLLRKYQKNVIAMLLVCAMVISLLPAMSFAATAVEENLPSTAPKPVETVDSIDKDSAVSLSITVNGEALELKANVAYSRAITRYDLQTYAVETAWAYYMKGSQVDYDSNPMTAVGDKNYGAYRNTEGQAPEYATSDTHHYSVCSYFVYDTYYNLLVDENNYGYRIGLGDTAADVRTRYFLDATPVDDPAYVLRWANENYNWEGADPTFVGVPEDITTAPQFVEWLTENWESILQPGDMMVALGSDNTGGHATMYIGNGMMLECTGGKYNMSTGADTTESMGGIRINAFEHYYLTPNGNSYLGTVYNQNSAFYVVRPINHIVDENDVYDPECGYALRASAISRSDYAGIEIDRIVDVSPYGTAGLNDTLTYSITITNNSSNTHSNVPSVTGDGVVVNYPNWHREHYGLESYTGMDYEGLPVTEPIPAGTTLVAGSITGGGTVKDGVISWELDLEAGESVTLTYTVKVDQAELGDVIVADSGKVANIPSNNLSNRVGGKKLTPDAEGYADLIGYAEQYTEILKTNGIVDVIYANVFGLDIDFPEEISTIVDQLFELKNVKANDAGGTMSMYVLKDWNADSLYRTMLVDRFIAGYRVQTHPLDNARVQDLDIDHYEVGDILVKVTSVEENAFTAIVYLGDGQFATFDSDGYATVSSVGNLFRDIFKSSYECVFLLRPTQAYEDITASLPAADSADVFTPNPNLESSTTVHTPAEPGTEDQWRQAIVETAYAYYRRNANAVYSKDALTALGSEGPLKSTWNVAPEYISSVSPYYGVEGFLIYEIYQNAVNVQLTDDQNGMLDVAALTAAYGVANATAQAADIVVLSDGKLALFLGDGKYLTMQDQDGPMVILENAQVTAVLQPLSKLTPHLTAAGAERIQHTGLDVTITSDIGVGSSYNTAVQNSKVTYTITVTNNSAAAYEDLEIVQFIPRKGSYTDEARYHSEPAGAVYAYTAGNSRLSWTLDLAAGETATFTYTITVRECLGGSDYLYYLTTNGKVGSGDYYLPMKTLSNRIGYNKPNAAQLQSMLELTTENVTEYGISTWNGNKFTSVAGIRSFYGVYLGLTSLNSGSKIPGISAIVGIKEKTKSTISMVDDAEAFYNGYGVWTDPDAEGAYPYGNQMTVEGFYGGERIYANQGDNSMILDPSLDYLEPGDHIMLYTMGDGTSYSACFWLYLGKTDAGKYKVMMLNTNVQNEGVVMEYDDPTTFFADYVIPFNANGDTTKRIAAYAVCRMSQVANISPDAEVAPDPDDLEVDITNSAGRFSSVDKGDTITYTITLTNNTGVTFSDVNTVLTLTGAEVIGGELTHSEDTLARNSYLTYTVTVKVTADVTEHVTLAAKVTSGDLMDTEITSNGVAYDLTEAQLDYFYNEVSKDDYAWQGITGKTNHISHIRGIYLASGSAEAGGGQVASGTTFLSKNGAIGLFMINDEGNYVFGTEEQLGEYYQYYQTQFENTLIMFGGTKHIETSHRAYVGAWEFSYDMMEPGDFIIINKGEAYYLYLGFNPSTNQHVFKTSDNMTVLKYTGTEATFVNSDMDSFIITRPSQGTDMSGTPDVEEEEEPGVIEYEITHANDLIYGGTVHNGDEFTFSVTVKNATDAAKTNVSVTEAVTNGSIIAVDGTACEAKASHTWTIDSLAAGESKTFTFKVKANGTYAQSVTATCTVGENTGAGSVRIASEFSQAQLDALNALDADDLTTLRGDLSAANFMRKLMTDVLGITKKGFSGRNDLKNYLFSAGEGGLVPNADQSSYAALWNSLVYYGGSDFAAQTNGKYVTSTTFDLDWLQPGDYVIGQYKVDEENSAQFSAMYVGTDGTNYKFIDCINTQLISYTDATFAEFVAAWENVFAVRVALSYDVYKTWTGLQVSATNGLTQFNSVETGSTVTYTVTIQNDSPAAVTGLQVNAVADVENANDGDVNKLTKTETVDIPAGETRTVTFTVDLTGVNPYETSNWKNFLNTTITVNGTTYSFSNQVSFGINDTKEAALLNNTTDTSAIANVRTIYQNTLGLSDTDGIISMGTFFNTRTGSSYPFTLSSDVYIRNTIKLTGRRNESYVVMWGGSQTSAAESDTQHIAAADFSFDYLQPGDMIGLNASSDTTYQLYLGKTTEGETTTYWFATSTAAKVGYTADQVSSVLPADTNYFVVARFCNFYDLSN